MTGSDSDADSNDELIREDNYYNLQFVVDNSPVKLYTTSTKKNTLVSKYEARTMHLLNTKAVKYQIIFVDLQDGKQAEMEAVSNTFDLPQLHFNGRYFGDFPKLQEMEDRGDLDKLLLSIGVHVKPKIYRSSADVPTKHVTAEARNGILVALASNHFIHLVWDEGKALFDNDEVQWVLRMDTEPVYVGPDTRYLVNKPSAEPHSFDVCAVDQQGQELSCPPNVTQPLGSVRIATPLADGVLSANVTPNSITLAWDNAPALPEGKSWMLLMDREPLYCGTDTGYTLATPASGSHLFSLRVTDTNGKDVTDKTRQHYGELIISAPQSNKKKQSSNVAALFGDASTISSTLAPQQTQQPEPSAEDMVNVQRLNEKDRELAAMAQRLEDALLAREKIEAALGIKQIPTNSTDNQRTAGIIDKITALKEAASLTSSAKEGVGKLEQEVESLRAQNFNLMAVELKTRDHTIERLSSENSLLREQLKAAEMTLEKICRQLELAPNTESRLLHDTIYSLQLDRVQFLNRAVAAERETGALRRVRDLLEDALKQSTDSAQQHKIEAEWAKRQLQLVEEERNDLRTKMDVFEESHLSLMRQVEHMTQSLIEREEKGILWLALNRLKQSIGTNGVISVPPSPPGLSAPLHRHSPNSSPSHSPRGTHDESSTTTTTTTTATTATTTTTPTPSGKTKDTKSKDDKPRKDSKLKPNTDPVPVPVPVAAAVVSTNPSSSAPPAASSAPSSSMPSSTNNPTRSRASAAFSSAHLEDMIEGDDD